jgi:hypothetical protein
MRLLEWLFDLRKGSQEMTETSPEGLSRRDALKRVAIAGGTLAWATPLVQTISAGPAFAQYPTLHNVSFIALNVTCAGTAYFIKYETDPCKDSGGADCFEDDPGKATSCEIFFTPTGTKADGEDLGFIGSLPDPGTGDVTITVPLGCTVDESAVKGGGDCCPGPTGTGDLAFSSPAC